jgi:hypothetical protein
VVLLLFIEGRPCGFAEASEGTGFSGLNFADRTDAGSQQTLRMQIYPPTHRSQARMLTKIKR